MYTKTFNVDSGGEHILQWYAVDHEQNQSEFDGPFTFKVDKIRPIIDLTYVVSGGNIIIGFEIKLTASASDSMSGMDYVEFYFNNVVQEKVTGSGPDYTWSFRYMPLPNMVLFAKAVDKAGNSDVAYIEQPSKTSSLKSSIFYPENNEGIENVLSHKIVELKNYKTNDKSIFDPASLIVVFNREIGENNWIDSNVSISIFAEEDKIDKIYYQLNNESWILYNNPIVISEDGFYDFSWYVIDSEGNSSTPDAISFKVDLTPPEINLTRTRLAINKVKFTAQVNDSTSGIDRVRFQSEYGRSYIDYDYPYEWIWTGFFKEKITATVYDKAGNSNSYIMKTRDSLSYEQQRFQPSNISFFIQILQKLMNFNP